MAIVRYIVRGHIRCTKYELLYGKAVASKVDVFFLAFCTEFRNSELLLKEQGQYFVDARFASG